MNYISKHLTVAAILLSAICANAQESVATASQSAAAPTAPQANPAATALANAQKSYVSGNWKEAASAYEKACPQQPKEKQAECLLWNVLALSQTGDAASFKKAGKRLDSLIQKVSPQESLYADLMMTSAQFRLYLGKYDQAAQDLIHAIETSKPHHNVVLQKVCVAVKSKTNNEMLNERCELLKNPDSLAAMQEKKTPVPASQPAPDTVAKATQQTPPEPEAPKPAAESKNAAKSAEPIAAESVKESSAPVSAVAPAPAVAAEPETNIAQPSTPPVTTAVPQQVAAPAAEYWVLQLGAFSVKDNATLLVSTLKKRKIKAEIVEQPRGEKILYLVQSGHFSTRDEAVDFGAKELAPLKVEFQPLLRK